MSALSSSNWIEIAALLLIVSAGLVLFWIGKRKLKRGGGIEGIITERSWLPRRQPMELEEEIRHLKARLGRK